MALNKIKVNDTTTVNTGVVYDITKATGQKYDTLSAALGTSGNNVPPEVREGGMSIRFVLNSDNKYLQYRYMCTEVTGTPNPFLDVDNWQGIDEEKSAYDFSISDDSGHDILQIRRGHLKTKHFDSSKNAISQEEKTKLASIETGAEVNNTGIENDDASDFSISDDVGNVILSILNGVLKTSKFDSRDFAKIEQIFSYIGTDNVFAQNPQSDYDNLIMNAKRKRLNTTKGIITLCHFSDLHAGEKNLDRLLTFNKRYENYVDDVLFTGDLVSEHGDESMPYWSDATKNILMCIGNHDAWVPASGENTEQRYNASTNLYILKQTYVYNKYIKPFVDNWNVTQPIDAETEGKSYYYKDYIVSGQTVLRLIVLDCMHYGTINDAIDDTHSKQDNWFVSTLEDARVNSIPVVCACHYWGDSNTRLDCSYNEYDKTVQDVLCRSISSIFTHSEGAMRVQAFINAGGEFICWLGGHSHYDAIGTLTEYPQQLQISISCANYDRNDYSQTQRTLNKKSMDCFNYVSFDTNDKLIKIVRIGADVDRYLNTKRTLVYRYLDFTDPITGVLHQRGLESCK